MGDGDPGAVEYDTIFELLANSRRRHVLYYLSDLPDGVTELDELANQIATWEADAKGEAVDDREQRITTSLHHEHLPRLTDAGVIDYDPRSRTLRYWSNECLERHLELAAEEELP